MGNRLLGSLKLLAVVFLLAGLMPVQVQAIGIAPSVQKINGMLPDTKVERFIDISREKPTEDIEVELRINGAIRDNLVFPGGRHIVLPAGEQKVRVPFTINAEGVMPGYYQARIFMDMKGGDYKKVRDILPSVKSTVMLTVTDEVKDEFKVRQFYPPQNDDCRPLSFGYFMSNLGNVESGPTKIEVSMKSGEKYVYEGRSVPMAKPFTDPTIKVAAQYYLLAGNHKADFVLFDKEGKEVLRKDKMSFRIGESKNFCIAKLKWDTHGYVPGVIGIGALMLFGWSWIATRPRKKRRRKQRRKTIKKRK